MMNKRKIIIITSKFLHVFVQHIIDELPLDCDVEIVEYKCFQDIKQIYQQYESTSDGFMLSGKAALAALEKALPDHRKPRGFFRFRSGFYVSTAVKTFCGTKNSPHRPGNF